MKKRLCAVLAALLAMGLMPAWAAPWPVNTPSVTALIDAGGAEILESGRYEAVFTVREGAVYAAGSPGGFSLYDAAGEPLPLGTVEMASAFDGGLIIRQNGLYGAVSDLGEVILEARWDQLAYDGEGGFFAIESSPLDEQSDAIIHIGPGGAYILTGVETMNGLQPVACGRMAYCRSDGRWGYVNARGERVGDALWRYAAPYADDAAIVASEAGFGVIDLEGRTIIEPQYLWVERGNNVFAALSREGQAMLFDANGALLFAVEASQAALVGDALAVTTDDAAMLYSMAGECFCREKASARFEAGVDGQYIVIDGAWGEACQRVVDAGGTQVGERFQRVLPLCAGRYLYMKISGAEYYSQELDELQTSWDYSSLRYGLMDSRGRVLTEAVYTDVQALDDDHLLMVSEAGTALADADGAVIRRWPAPEVEAPTDG